MPFPRHVRTEALERAHYTCVLCRRPGFLEVHHILAEATGGPDTIDNACALCAQCHADFGANPERRNALKEIRDWWWKHCAASTQDRFACELGRRLESAESSVSVSIAQIAEELKALIRSELSRRHDAVASEDSLNAIADVAQVKLPLRLAVYDAFNQLEKEVWSASERSGIDPAITGTRNRVHELEQRGHISSELRVRFAILREIRDQVWAAHESAGPSFDAAEFLVGVYALVSEFNRVGRNAS